MHEIAKWDLQKAQCQMYNANNIKQQNRDMKMRFDTEDSNRPEKHAIDINKFKSQKRRADRH